MTTFARYDEFADWYVEFTSAWEVGPLALLPDGLSGQRVLDLACGHGQLSRHLARLGAEVTGVDLSTVLLMRAAGLERAEPLGIRYVIGDVCDARWWDGTVYDCDFNGMLELDRPERLNELTGSDALAGRAVRTGAHCFGCTAGAGSSCGGATVAPGSTRA